MMRIDRASRKTFLQAVACGAAALGARGSANAQAAPVSSLRVGLIPSDFGGEPYYAKDLGFFTRHGLDVELTGMNNGPAIGAAVAGGALDIGLSNLPSLAIAHYRGLPFTLLAPANLYESGTPTVGLLAVKRTSKLNMAADFTGKIVAVGAINNITHVGARAWIDANGGDSNSVRWLEVPISTMATELLGGRIDAAILDQGVYPTLDKPGDPIRVVAATFTAIAPKFISSGWFCTHEWLARHPVEARKFVATMAETAQWANERSHHEASAAILAKYLKSSAADVNASTRVVYGTAVTTALVQPLIDVVARYKLIPAPFAATELISPLATAG